MNKIKVLFVCIHNSARSQMAEGFLNHLGGKWFHAESAGIEAGKLNLLAVEVMHEAGVDISHHTTKEAIELYKEGRTYNYVVTVCDAKNSERCPIFPGVTQRLAWMFDDPSAAEGSREERLAITRAVRDEIKAEVEHFIASYQPTT